MLILKKKSLRNFYVYLIFFNNIKIPLTKFSHVHVCIIDFYMFAIKTITRHLFYRKIKKLIFLNEFKITFFLLICD